MGDFSPIPGSRAGSPAKRFFAAGNTTGAASSGVGSGQSLVFSAAGGLSMGISGNSILVSGSSTQGITALGNTTATTSTQTQALSGVTLSGAGAASIGFNAGTLVVSAPSTTTTVNYFEPNFIANNTSNVPFSSGTFYVQPIDIPTALTIDQINFLASWFTQDLFAQTSSVATTASSSFAFTLSVGLYTQQTGTAFNSWSSLTSTTATWGVKDSISASSSSQTKSQTLFYNLGGVTTSATMTTSTSSGTVNATGFFQSAFQAYRRIDVPWATSFAPGAYMLAVGGSMGAGGSINPLVSMVYVQFVSNATTYFAPVGWSTTGSGTNFFGVGSTSSVGSVLPSTLNPSALSVHGNQPRLWVLLRNGGT